MGQRLGKAWPAAARVVSVVGAAPPRYGGPSARESGATRWDDGDSDLIHYVLGHKLTDDRWDDFQAEYGPTPFYDAVY